MSDTETLDSLWQEADALELDLEEIQDDIDHISLQLAENLSWIAKAEYAQKKKKRQMVKLQEQRSIIKIRIKKLEAEGSHD